MRTALLVVLGIVAFVAIVGSLLRIAYPLPPLDGRAASTALPASTGGRLGKRIAALAQGRAAGLTGVMPLPNPRDSFAARVKLVRAAQSSLDVQYYIWRSDVSGTLLLQEARAAADRGVRVRLLIDDNGTAGLDELLSALDAHPRIEVRLFNPFTIRNPKWIGYLLDFPRLNRRMHNKSMTADGVATIVGGRNVGDEYFGASDEGLFADMDVLAVGAVVPEVSRDFDRYWNSDSAYPLASILGRGPLSPRRVLRAHAAATWNDPRARAYRRAVTARVPDDFFLDGPARLFEWVPVAMVSDDPAKALDQAPPRAGLLHGLTDLLGRPRSEVGVVSAYFVPTDAGTAAFAAMAARGVKVSVFTNGLASTDVGVVHAGYAKHRRALLEAGVRLWEMKGTLSPRLGMTIVGSGSGTGRERMAGPVARASRTSLHAKTFTADRRSLFVGSFNFDPRSADLNTEMGFVIDSPAMAGRLQDEFDRGLYRVAYELQLRDGEIVWLERTARGMLVHQVEPNTTWLQRGVIRLLSRLPIDWLL